MKGWKNSIRYGTLMLWMFIAFQLNAQHHGHQRVFVLKGNVNEISGEGLRNASVLLLHAADSTPLALETSDKKGNYRFTKIPAGRYLVKVQRTGFHLGYSAPFTVDTGNVATNIPMVALTSLTLSESFISGFYDYVEVMKSSFSNPSVYSPLIYLFLVYLITFMLEVIFPKRINYPLIQRKGFWTDLLYIIFIDFTIQVIGLYAMTSAVEFLTLKGLGAMGIQTPIFNLHDALPPGLRFVFFFIAIDFLQWFGHFLLHRSNFLWQFHKIHHAQETLGFASTRHFHFGEYLVLKPAFWIPFALLGFKMELYVIYYVWIAYFLTFLSHTNIKVNFGFLNYIFITPQTHYWHHSRNIPGKYGVNYASALAIWDVLFGFFYNPKDKQPILGIPDNDVPDSFLGQMAYPFKRLFTKAPDPAQNKDADVKPTQTRQEKRKGKS